MSNSIKIAAVGDICLGDHYFSIGHGTAEKCRKRNTIGISTEIMQVLKGADIAFCNIECPLSTDSKGINAVEKAVFRGHPSFAQLVFEAGFTLANIANNHICQHGEQAFHDTINALNKHSIATIGIAGQDNFSSIPYFRKIQGISICFIGYSLVLENYMPQQNLYACNLEHEILQDVRSLSRKVDIVVVSIHAGEEGVILPHPDIIRFYRQVIDAGANIVLGHHPHVFQPIERWNQGLIIYSLGNFIFDLFWNPLLFQSAVVVIEIEARDIINIECIPVVMEMDYFVSTLNGEPKEEFLKQLRCASNLLEGLIPREYSKVFMKQKVELEKRQIVSKGSYFLRNFTKGQVYLKSQFLAQKLKNQFI